MTAYSPADALRIALQHHQAGELSQAETIYRKILEQAPDYADAWHLLGMVFYQVGQLSTAADLIRQALQLAQQPQFYANLGEVYRADGQFIPALQQFDQALHLQPDLVSAHNNRAMCLSALGRVDEAMAAYQRALEINPGHANAWHNLGCLELERRQPQAALAHFREAVRLAPQSGNSWFAMGNCLVALADAAGAQECFRRAIAVQPALNPMQQIAQGLATRLQLVGSLEVQDHHAWADAQANDDGSLISFIVCSHRPERLARFRQEVLPLFQPAELLAITDARSLAEGYSRGMAQANGAIWVFCHDDIAIRSPQPRQRLLRYLRGFDVLGVAGARELVGPSWCEAGWPHLRGSVAHPPTTGQPHWEWIAYGCGQPVEGDIVALDGLFIAAHREVARNIGWDAATFDGFHGYDVDFTWRAHQAGYRLGVINELLVVHDSRGSYDPQWLKYADKLRAKHQWSEVPAGIEVAPLRAKFDQAAALSDFALAFTAQSRSGEDYRLWCRVWDTPSAEVLARLAAQDAVNASRAGAPLISVVLPVYNTPEALLRLCLDSVLRQTWPRWQLCIADDASDAPHVWPLLQHYAAADDRIRLVRLAENSHISAASNQALALATGDFVALLDHDDELAPLALHWVAEVIAADPAAGLIYSDEDKLDEQGRRDPYFKPDWNPDLLRSQNYVCHLAVYATALVRQVGGFRCGFEGSQDWDLVLRCVEHLSPQHIHHIPRVLYHWRAVAGSTAAGGTAAKPYVVAAAVRALNEHLQRCGEVGQAAEDPATPGQYRIRYALPDNLPLVSVVVPTRNHVEVLRVCVDGLLNHTDYAALEVLIVDNGSDEPATLAYLQGLQADPRVTILRDDGPFNYSALNNRAVAVARGELVCLLNNDIEMIHADWLREMVSQALRPGVGAVGARLWYPDRTLQHGGVILVGGVAGHAHKNLPAGQAGYAQRAALTQNLSAVTAACLVVRTALYRQFGGLDEQLTVAFNDVDFCLRLAAAGWRNVWTPYAELVHHESKSRGLEDTAEKRRRFDAEIAIMRARWGELLRYDPAYNPNLTLDREDFGLAWPPRLAYP